MRSTASGFATTRENRSTWKSAEPSPATWSSAASFPRRTTTTRRSSTRRRCKPAEKVDLVYEIVQRQGRNVKQNSVAIVRRSSRKNRTEEATDETRIEHRYKAAMRLYLSSRLSYLYSSVVLTRMANSLNCVHLWPSPGVVFRSNRKRGRHDVAMGQGATLLAIFAAAGLAQAKNVDLSTVPARQQRPVDHLQLGRPDAGP